MDNLKPLGRFRIDAEHMRDWKSLLPLMGQCVVLQAWCDFARNCMEYEAYSDLFTPIDVAIESPLYQIVMKPGEPVCAFRQADPALDPLPRLEQCQP